MISLAKMKEVMNQNGLGYSDEELLIVREFLYRLAEITTSHYERKEHQQVNVISINKTDHYDKKESISIHPGEYRRAS